MSNSINYSLPCIAVTYSNSSYKAVHKRDQDRTFKRTNPTNFELSEFENAKKAAQDLIDSWELVGSGDGWEIIAAGHDANKWYFIAKTF
tara:strand:+ start:895 stop:1161 length:267 start_codon:yes stop_codon:yes gene_type:complete